MVSDNRTGKIMKNTRGFTLIELMIVVAIIAIISAIAYPSYQDSVRKTNRSDAMDTMLSTAQRLERCYTSYGSYDNVNCPVQTGASITSAKAHYKVDVTSAASIYSLKATPISTQQLKDTKCATFELDNTGKKTSTPAGNTCW
jgi:type IV pilus assembly protein PilE